MNKTIEVKIHYHKNSNGEMEPDWEEMTEEFEEALQEIDEKIEMKKMWKEPDKWKRCRI